METREPVLEVENLKQFFRIIRKFSTLITVCYYIGCDTTVEGAISSRRSAYR